MTNETLNKIIKNAQNIIDQAKEDKEQTESGFQALDFINTKAGKLYVWRDMNEQGGFMISLMPKGTSEFIDIALIQVNNKGDIDMKIWNDPMSEFATNNINISKKALNKFKAEYGDELDPDNLPENFFVWKDIVNVNGNILCLAFPVSGKGVSITKYDWSFSMEYAIDEFIAQVANKYNVPEKSVKTWMRDGISGFDKTEFNKLSQNGNLEFGIYDCGLYLDGQLIHEFIEDHEDFEYKGNEGGGNDA